MTLRRRDGLTLTGEVRELSSYHAVFIRGDYECEAVPWGDLATVVDVGANIGVSVLWLRLKCPFASRTLALEPNEQIVSRLKSNLCANACTRDVQIIAAALADHDGVTFFSAAEFSVNSRLDPDALDRVRSVSLPTLLMLAGGQIDLLKLDCEGCEFSLIEQSHCLKAIRAIVGEYHSERGDWSILRHTLESNGFAVYEDGVRRFAAVRR